MAAIAFDPLEYSRLLEGAGVPRDQAEVHARAMTTAFLHNVDALVTKDYLDSRFSEFETRVEANIDHRFTGFDGRLASIESGLANIDSHLAGIDSRLADVDSHFAGIDSRFADIDSRFASIDVRFARIDGQFGRVYVMLGVIMVAVAIPALQSLLG